MRGRVNSKQAALSDEPGRRHRQDRKHKDYFEESIAKREVYAFRLGTKLRLR